MKLDFPVIISIQYKNFVQKFEIYSSFTYTVDDPVIKEVISLFTKNYLKRFKGIPENKDLDIKVIKNQIIRGLYE